MAPVFANQLYPLYDTTFDLYRVSPLHTGESSLDDSSLRELTRKFREILVGDVIRGVPVGLVPDHAAAAYTGALQDVKWTGLPYEERWNELDEDTTMTLNDWQGVVLRITYDSIMYTAVMLKDVRARDWDETSLGVSQDDSGFEHFPLLLLKMPASVRVIFTEFLATTFDAHISSLEFPSTFVTTSFEQYLAYICVNEDGDSLDIPESNRATKSIMGAVDVHIGFDLPGGSSALKTIDIKLSRDDLPRIVARGKLANREEDTPLWNALTAYVNAHLALNLKHEKVKILRIACDAFVFGAEGRLKLIDPGPSDEINSSQRRATRRLLNSLITAAKGGQMSNIES